MLQVWLLYNLLVELHRTIWCLQQWPELLSKGLLSEKLPSNPQVATLPRTAWAGFEVWEASRLQRLSQPWGSQESAAGIALETELWAPWHPSGLPALQCWPLQERKSPNKRHTLKYPSAVKSILSKAWLFSPLAPNYKMQRGRTFHNTGGLRKPPAGLQGLFW